MTSFFPSQLFHEEGGIDESSSIAYLECLDSGTCQRNLPLRQSSSLNTLSSTLRRKQWPSSGGFLRIAVVSLWSHAQRIKGCQGHQCGGSSTGLADGKKRVPLQRARLISLQNKTFNPQSIQIAKTFLQPRKYSDSQDLCRGTVADWHSCAYTASSDIDAQRRSSAMDIR